MIHKKGWLRNMEIEKKLIEIVKEILGDLALTEVSVDKNLVDELGMDSKDMLRFILGIEENFNIEFEDEELDIEVLSDLSKVAEIVIRKTL